MSTSKSPEALGNSPPPKPRFELSRTNAILFGLIVACHVVAYLFRGDFSIGRTAELFGKVVGYSVITLLLSWIAYCVGFRSVRAGKITFNVVILLLALGQFIMFTRRAEQNRLLEKMEADQQAFREELHQDEVRVDIDVVDKYVGTMRQDFDQMRAKGTPSEREFFRLMQEFLDEMQQVQHVWIDAFNAAQAPQMFDFGGLTDDAEYERRLKTVETYLDTTRKYDDFMANMIPRMRAKLGSSPTVNAEMVRGAIDGARQKHQQQAAAFVPLMAAHRDYGQSITALLTLLHADPSKWKQSGKQVLFTDDRLKDQFNELITKLQNLENRINELALAVRKTI